MFCRTDPEYFKVISRPIDLTRIQQKIKTEEYGSLDELRSDIELLIANSKKYFKVHYFKKNFFLFIKKIFCIVF